MALLGGTVQEKHIDEHRGEQDVLRANGEGDGPKDGRHGPYDVRHVPNDVGHAPKDGGHVWELAENVGSEVPSGSPSVVTVRKRGRPRLNRNLSVGESVVKKVATAPKKKVVPTPKIEPSTAYSSDRPVRERKSVQRFITASASGQKSREFVVKKGSGSGTALKDIPNVAYKLSRRSKADHILKVLHSVIYGKRVKVLHIKNNILQFSGFVPSENKTSERVKEKLDKIHKDDLANLCDVLDLQVSKTISKKEELVAKVIEFLEAPRITENKFPEEKEQKKRKRAGNESPGKPPGKITEKGQKKFSGSSEEYDAKKDVGAGDIEADRESKLEEIEFSKEPEKELTEKESSKENHDHDSHEAKKRSSNSSSNKESKIKADKENVEKREEDEEIHRTAPSSTSNSTDKKSKRNEFDSNVGKYEEETEDRKTLRKPPKGNSKVTDNISKSVIGGDHGKKEDAEMKVKKKRGRKPKPKMENPGDNYVSAKDALRKDQYMSYKSEATYGRKEEGKRKSWGKARVSYPTDDELRFVIRELLNEVDFNTATLSDVVKQLGRHFGKDFTEMKAHIRILVQEELTKITEEDDDDDNLDEY